MKISERAEIAFAVVIAAFPIIGAIWLFFRFIDWINAWLPEWAR